MPDAVPDLCRNNCTGTPRRITLSPVIRSPHPAIIQDAAAGDQKIIHHFSPLQKQDHIIVPPGIFFFAFELMQTVGPGIQRAVKAGKFRIESFIVPVKRNTRLIFGKVFFTHQQKRPGLDPFAAAPDSDAGQVELFLCTGRTFPLGITADDSPGKIQLTSGVASGADIEIRRKFFCLQRAQAHPLPLSGGRKLEFLKNLLSFSHGQSHLRTAVFFKFQKDVELSGVGRDGYIQHPVTPFADTEGASFLLYDPAMFSAGDIQFDFRKFCSFCGIG